MFPKCYSVSKFALLHLCDLCVASAARVLPSVPHQERLRGDRAEHLPPQPRLWSHVLGDRERECIQRRPRREKTKTKNGGCKTSHAVEVPPAFARMLRQIICIELQWTKQTARRVAASSQIRGKR